MASDYEIQKLAKAFGDGNAKDVEDIYSKTDSAASLKAANEAYDKQYKEATQVKLIPDGKPNPEMPTKTDVEAKAKADDVERVDMAKKAQEYKDRVNASPDKSKHIGEFQIKIADDNSFSVEKPYWPVDPRGINGGKDEFYKYFPHSHAVAAGFDITKWGQETKAYKDYHSNIQKPLEDIGKLGQK